LFVFPVLHVNGWLKDWVLIELDLKKSGEQPPGNIVYIGDIPKNVEQLTPRFFKMKNERYIKLRGHVEEAELAKPAKRGRSRPPLEQQTRYYPL
jgi:hypothetical protein